MRFTPTLTRNIAWAVATDTGNRSMRSSGRRTWNEEDYNAAVVEFERLWPITQEIKVQQT